VPSPLPGFDDEIKLYPTPVIGVRAFRLQVYGTEIKLSGPLFPNFLWQPGVNTRICYSLGSKGRAPEHDLELCSCGFYAYHHHSGVSERDRSNSMSVIGIIEGSGKVMLGTKGFRANEARISALSMSKYQRFIELDKAVHHYYPDVEFFERPADMYSRYPSSYLDLFYSNL